MDRAWFASDVHLNPADPERTRRFLAFLAAWRRADCPLYILGDLFDWWLGRGHAASPDFAEALAGIREGAAGHAHPILFLFGNRDFLIRSPADAPAGLSAVGESAEIDLGGRRTLLVHGDQLCTQDRRHQRYRAVMLGRTVRFLDRVLPFPVKQAIARKLRKASRGGMGKAEIPPEALLPHFRRGIDAVVCGHIHKQGTHAFDVDGRPKTLHVLGDWHQGTPFLEFDGGFRFRSSL